MQEFKDLPDSKLPLILGLSATLLKMNIKKTDIEISLREMEETYRAKIISISENTDITR